MKASTNFSLLVQMACAAIILIAIFWFYLPVFVKLSHLLLEEDYSYGLLLPLVSAYIIYLKLPQIRQVQWRPSWFGLLIIATGFGLYSFGELAASFYIPCFSFLIVIVGLLFLLGRWPLVRLLIFPLILLALTIPMDTYLIKWVTLPLQLISSQLATGFLSILGIPVFRQGNVIDLGVRQLQVIDACSGLRYILPLVSYGIIYCYFFQRRLWKATILIVSVIPLAIIFNSIRVAAMGLFPSLQEGFKHSLTGWFIFLFCFAFLSGLNWFLNLLRPESAAPVERETPTRQVSDVRSPISYIPYLLGALTTIIFLGPVAHSIGEPSPIPLRQSFNNFPTQIGPWKGERQKVDPASITTLRTNEYIDIDFYSVDGPVELWIAYYPAQTREVYIHPPLTCLKGGGWKMIDSKEFQLAPGSPVKYLLLEQDGKRLMVLYWYLLGGRWLTYEKSYLDKLYLSYDGLVNRRTDGALIRLSTPVGQDIEAAQERLTSFGSQLIPVLWKFININR